MIEVQHLFYLWASLVGVVVGVLIGLIWGASERNRLWTKYLDCFQTSLLLSKELAEYRRNAEETAEEGEEWKLAESEGEY